MSLTIAFALSCSLCATVRWVTYYRVQLQKRSDCSECWAVCHHFAVAPPRQRHGAQQQACCQEQGNSASPNSTFVPAMQTPDWGNAHLSFYGVPNSQELRLKFKNKSSGIGLSDEELGYVNIEVNAIRHGVDRHQRGLSLIHI